MKDIQIERMIVDIGSDCSYSLGVKSEYEFLFEFVVRDEIANITVSFDHQHTIAINHPYSRSYYSLLGSSVIIESNIYDKFIDALEVLKFKKEEAILIYISPEYKYLFFFSRYRENFYLIFSFFFLFSPSFFLLNFVILFCFTMPLSENFKNKL